MALINDNRLFTGGSERIDTRPHVALYAQLKQREQARNDAFDEYVRNLNKNINPAGLRNQERPVFEDKLRQWQEFGMQNREALRNPRKDNGMASMKFQGGYQELQNLIAESKQEEEKKKPLIEVMTDPNKRDRLNEDELFPKIQSHDKGIYTKDPQTGEWVRDPNRRSFNVADLNYEPKPWDQGKFFQGLDDVKPSQTTESRIKNPKDLTETVTTTGVFGQQDKDVIASRAVAEYGQDKSFKNFVDKLNPKDYNDIYKDAFGHDIQTPGDLAAAYALKGKQQQHTSTKIEADKFAQDKELARLRHNYAIALKRTPGAKAEGSDDDNLYLQDYWDGAVEKALSNPENERQGNVLRGGEYQLEIDPVIAKAFIRQGLEPEEMTVTKEGVVTPKYYTNVDDGKGGTKKVLVAELSKPMTRTQALLTMGVKATTGKQRYAEGKAAVDEKKGTYHIKGKDYSEGDLIKMGYTIDQIKPYRK